MRKRAAHAPPLTTRQPQLLLGAPCASNTGNKLLAHFSSRAKSALLEARKSGLIIEGSHRFRNSDKQKVVGIILSSDIGCTTRAQITEKYNQVPTFIFPQNSLEIGRLMRRGPRSVLGLRPSRKTQSLIDSLRGWDSVG